MQMNLYGVASCNLDRMRGRDIKAYVRTLAAVYTLVVFLSFFFPPRLIQKQIGQDTFAHSEKESDHVLHHWFDLEDP